MTLDKYDLALIALQAGSTLTSEQIHTLSVLKDEYSERGRKCKAILEGKN